MRIKVFICQKVIWETLLDDDIPPRGSKKWLTIISRIKIFASICFRCFWSQKRVKSAEL